MDSEIKVCFKNVMNGIEDLKYENKDIRQDIKNLDAKINIVKDNHLHSLEIEVGKIKARKDIEEKYKSIFINLIVGIVSAVVSSILTTLVVT